MSLNYAWRERRAADKVEAMLAWRGADGRVRGSLFFHGAGPGRWTGKGVQPQNFRRDSEGLDAKLAALRTGDLAHIASLYPRPLEIIGDCSRAMICAAPGHRLLIGDYSGIQSRLVGWISGQQSKLDAWAAYDASGDPHDEPYYKLGISGGIAEDIARDKGKIIDLAFSFQGSVDAWRNLAPSEDTSTDEEIIARRKIWRDEHPFTVVFWKAINRVAINAVHKPGETFTYKRYSFLFEGRFLRLILPSGRSISYPYPRLGVGKFD